MSTSSSSSQKQEDRSVSPRPVKVKLSRGSRACVQCRKAKTRCMGWETPPCTRCHSFCVECEFMESRRGKPTKATRPPQSAISRPHAQRPSDLQVVSSATSMPSAPSLADVDMDTSPANLNNLNNPQDSDSFDNPVAYFLPNPPGIIPSVPNQTFVSESSSSTSATASRPPTSSAPQPTQARIPAPPAPSAPSPSLSVTHSHLSGESFTRSLDQSPGSDDMSLHDLQPVHPLGVMLEASVLAARTLNTGIKPGGEGGDSSPDFGIASGVDYFTKGTGGEEGSGGNTSELLTFLTEEDVNALFEIFWRHLHIHFAAIDKEYSSPSAVLKRSPALFNAICCISGKYYSARPDLVPLLRLFAKKELGTFPIEKSLEFVQAQLLYLTFKPIPAVTYNMDMNWIRIGLAVRMAQDLNLHRAQSITTDAIPFWRIRSMRRTWLLCCVLERTVAVQLGKKDVVSKHETRDERPDDTVEDSRLMTAYQFQDLLEKSLEATRAVALGGGSGHDDSVYELLQRQLDDWRELGEEQERRKEALVPRDQARQIAGYRVDYAYAQLLVASITLKHALDSDSSYQPYALAKYQTSALSLLHTFRDSLSVLDYANYCTDFQFCYVTYAAVSLLRSVQPQFRFLIIDKIAAGKLISKTATLLENAARTWDHLPYLQATFLRRVLRARLPEFVEQPTPAPHPRLNAPIHVPGVNPFMETGLTPREVAPAVLNPPIIIDGIQDLWNASDFADPAGSTTMFNWDEFWAAGVTTRPASPSALELQ